MSNPDYWVGPYGVLVDWSTEFVVNSDNTNLICKYGKIRHIGWNAEGNKPLSEQEYLQTYSTHNENTNKYFYNGIDGWVLASLSIP